MINFCLLKIGIPSEGGKGKYEARARGWNSCILDDSRRHQVPEIHWASEKGPT